MFLARQRNERSLYVTLWEKVLHDGTSSPGLTGFFEAELSKDLDNGVRDDLLATLNELGRDGRLALGRRLAAIGYAGAVGADAREAGRILDLLGEGIPAVPGIVPPLVSMLRGKRELAAAKALNRLDQDATTGLQFIAERLRNESLPPGERDWLRSVDRRLREANRRSITPPNRVEKRSRWTDAILPPPHAMSPFRGRG